MQSAVTKALAVVWLLKCLVGSISGSPQRSYWSLPQAGFTSNYPEVRNNNGNQYESIDKFQLEQKQNQQEQGPGQYQPRYDYEDQYSNQFRNEQESYYQSLLRVTENPLAIKDSENQETFTDAQESQAYYQDYLPLDENENFNAGNKDEDEKSFRHRDENAKDPTDEKIAVLMEKLLLKENSLDRTSLNDLEALNSLENEMIAQATAPDEIRRGVRQVRGQQPGFLWTIARLAFEKVNDTKSAANQIGTIIRSGIATGDSPTTTTTTSTTSSSIDIDMNSSNNNNTISSAPTTTTTTTAAPFRLSGPVLQGIIRRNVKGLIRLFNLEWRDAMNASRTSVREFQRDLGNQVRPFLEDNPNVFG